MSNLNKYTLLERVFGYTEFRPGQEGLIDAVLSGRDVFGIMPTGGGKSICYQVPALLLPGITLVVSPLISLMRDQVLALKAAGVPAAYINSTLNAAQMRQVYRNMLAGQYKIIYVAPERLDYPGFGSLVEKLHISFLAVDEAHCISQWGQDFRPSYLRIVNFIDSLPVRPVVGAFTATATSQVREDVEWIMKLQDPLRTVTGFDRPNLFFEVMHPEKKDPALLKLLSGLSPTAFLLILNVILLIVGCFFEGGSATLILAPLVLPLAEKLGINIMHLGIVFVVNLSIGMFTPPFGLNIFVTQGVLKKSMGMISKSLIPYIICYIIVLVLLTFIPQLSLVLL